MSEQINPITGLENNTEPAPIILKKSDLNVNANLTEAKISPMRELLKPVDLADVISDSADSKFIQAVVPSDFLSNDNQAILDKYSSNVESAKNSYLKQLDDEQNMLESTAAGVGKFVGKVATGVPLGILGTAWGLLTLDLVNENVFDRMYDSAREGLNKALPVYSDNPNYHNLGFFDKLFTEPGKLLGDEVGDALAFSTSAILTEVIMSMATAATFGAAAPAQAAASVKLASRGAKLFNNIKNGKAIFKNANVADKVADITKSLDAANDVAKIQNFYQKSIGTTSGLLFGSSLEARLEARGAQEQYVGQQVQNFKNEFGFDPTQEQVANFEKESESVMWATYGLNMAILSTSMMAQHTNLVFKGYQGSKKLKAAADQIENTSKGLALKEPNKYVKYATLAVKNPLTESLEEFSQGVVSNTAVEYFANTYHPKANIESLNFLETAGKNAVEYFNSTEGGNSMGIGFLVGALGMPMPKKLGGLSGGIYGDIKGYNKSRADAQKIIDQINSQGSFSDTFKENYKNMVFHNLASNKMAESSDANDAFEFKNAENDDLFSYVYNRTALGFNSDLIEEVDAMKKMSLEQFNQEYGIKEVSEFKTEEEKNKQIAKVENLIKDVNKYSEVVDNIIEANKLDPKVAEQVKPYIVHAASTLKNLDVREEELTTKLNDLVGITKQDIDSFESKSKTLPILAKLSGLARKEKSGKLTEKEKELKKELLKNSKENESIYNSLIAAEKIPSIEELANTYRPTIGITKDGRIDNSVDMTEFMAEASKKLDAVSGKADAKINRQEAEQLLKDVAKIKNRRETFSIYYDFLTTKQGAEALAKAAEVLQDNLVNDVQDHIDNKAEEAATKATTEADDAYVSTVSADASDEVKEKIAKVKDSKAKEGLKKIGDIDKNNLFDHIKNRWNTSNPELRELYNKEKPQFLEKFAGRLGLPTLPNIKNAPPNAIKSYIQQALDGPEGNQLADELIEFFNANKEALTETIESDVKKALDENEEVQTIEPTEPKYANYQPIKSPADANRTQGSEFAMEFNGEYWEFSRDENGQLIDNEDFNLIVDSEYANTEVEETDTVTIELSLEHTFGTDYGKANKTNTDKLALVVVHTDKNGVKHPISTVAAYQDKLITQGNRAQYEALKAMRADIFNQLIKDGYIDNQFNVTAKGKALGNTLIPTNYSSTIELVLPGRRIHSLNQEDYKPVTKALGKDVVLGVAISTEGRTEIQFPNSNKETLVLPNVQPGAVYALVEEKGASFPVRLKTRKVTAEEINIVKDLLDEAKKLDLSTPEGKANLAEIKSQINDIVYVSENELAKGLSNNNQLEILKNHISSRRAQVSRFKINTKGYNEALGDKVVTSISDRPTSRNFVLNGYNVNNKSNVAEEVTVSRTSKKEKTPETTAATFVPVEPYTDAEGNVIPKGPEITTSTESQTQTTGTEAEIEAKKADIERRRQKSINDIKQRPNETLFTAPYYKKGYNFKQLPTISTMRTEAEEKEYYEILTNNNTLTDVFIQVKTREEAEKLVNAKYNAELKAVEQPTSQSEINKKADVEKRRQEELKEVAEPREVTKVETYEAENINTGEKQLVQIRTSKDGKKEIFVQGEGIQEGRLIWKSLGNKFSQEVSNEVLLQFVENPTLVKTQNEQEFLKEQKENFKGKTVREKINAKYDAELAALESIEVKPEVKSTVDVTKIINEIIANKEFIKLKEDGTAYINTKTGKEYQRVTTFISDEEVTSNALLESSQTIGTKVDELVRDFFADQLKDLASYDVSSIEELKSFIFSLSKIKKTLDEKGEKVLANDILLYNDSLGIAGTVDLLTYDSQGNFRIYDMKTMRGDNFKTSYKGDSNNKYESVLYGKSKKQKHTEQLSLYRILLNNTHGVKAKTIAIMPIEIDYGPGDTSSRKLNLLPGVKLEPLDKVKTAELQSTVNKSETKPEVKSKIPVSALGESMGSNVVEESTPTVVKKTRINLNEDSDTPINPRTKFKLKDGKSGKINTTKALEWLKNALPNIPVKVLGDYVKILNEHGSEAWGVFRNGGIEFLENAPQGVPYHEAFHAIFNSYLSESDQVLMMTEAQAKTGLTDDLALEEWLADKFADFMITKFEDKSLGTKILEFFRNLLQSLNLVSDSKLNEYFTELSQTVYKGEKRVITESRFKNKDPFTATQRYNRIAMLSDMFMQVLNAQKNSVENKNKSINSIINNYTFTTKIVTTPIYGDNTEIEVSEPITFKGVAAMFADVYKGQLMELYNNSLDVANKYDASTPRGERAILANEQLALVLDNFFVKRGDSYELSDLLVDASNALKENYINVRINSIKSDPITVEDTNEELKEDAEIDDVESLDKWMVSSAKLNTKDTASWILKFEVSNIDKKDGFDDIGYPIKYSAENLMATIKHDMVDLLDVGEMVEYMNAHKNIKPFYSKILELMEANPQFEAAFFNTFSTVKVGERLMVKSVESENGELITKWVTIDNSGVNNTDLLLEEWDSAFKARLRATSQLGKEDGRKKTPVEKMIKAKADLDNYLNSVFRSISSLEPMVTAKGLRMSEANKISSYLNEFGVVVTADTIKKIFDNSYLPTVASGASVSATIKVNPLLLNLKGSMGTMLEQMLEYAKTYNPENTKRNPLLSEKKLSDVFVKSVANTIDTIYESSALNADGEKVMVNRVPNFLHRQILKLKKNKNGIIEKYKRDPFYTNNLWLSELESGGASGLFKYMEVGGVKEGDNGNTYFDLSPRDKIVTSLLNYFGNTNNSDEANNAWYESPILADMNKLPLISMKKYDINEVVKHLENVYKTETERIERVKADQDKYNRGETVDLIEFYHYVGTKDAAGFAEARGLKRHYLPISVGQSLNESIKEYLDTEVSNYMKKIKILGVASAIGSDKYIKEDFVRRFIYNKFLADINMNQLFNGDSAYYKSDTDMSKRTSQLGKPAQLLSVTNIPATYNTMYFENLIVDVSGAYQDIIDATEGAKKDALLNALSGVDRADAQGVISIERWKDIMSGQGLFKDEYAEAYKNIKENKATAKDLSLIMQPIKPFYYGLESVGNKLVPTQNKNSEYVLLPSMRGSNPSVDKILDLFDSGIQSVQFHSAVKVGAMKIQNLDSLTDISPESIAGKFVTLSNSTYGIQLNVPEHHMDSEVLFGTQIRKLIISNLKDTNKFGKYIINGSEYSKDELLNLYMDTINANLIEDSAELDKFFEDNSKLVDLLSAEVRDRGLAKKYLKTLALDSENEFIFPLFFPITSKKAESLMSSLFANRITKQKIKGGSFVQVSDVLSSKNLKVIRDKNTGAIIEMEAMLPWTSKKFMPLNDNGEVDFDYIKENHPELLEAVGFRIPTEDKYSMPVIKIVGFLPQQSGGTIMLPADFIALSGSDFDVDKLFVMLKEFGPKGEKIESGPETKESRNNLLIDITRGILQDPYHAKEIINPGSFVRFKNLRDKINDLAGIKNSDNFNINLPTNQLELFMRNTAGKKLIGIFANHNVNHALAQHVGISVRALDANNNVKTFQFTDGDKAYNLNGSIATEIDGEYTSRFLAELLAAAVDNAKDPVLSSLNINTYTADFVSYLLRTGLSPELTMLFINQPVIKSISDKYFNSNEDRKKLVTILKNAKTAYPTKPEYSNIPLSKADLEANIQSMNKDTQSRVLSYFLNMLPASEKLGTITQSMRADAKPSKTMTANSQFLKKYDRLDKSIKSDSSPISMVHYFTELGIRKANETLSKYFPWQNEKFTAIKNMLTSIKEYELTEQEEDFVNAQVISYLTKDYELFNINEEERFNLYNDLPAKFSELKAGELANNMFMQVTSLVEAGTKKSGKYKIIGVDNIQTISETQKEAVERSFLELYESHPEFAKELLKYSYITSGTSFTRYSYLQLLPVEIFNIIKDSNGVTYQDYLKNAVKSNFDIEEFVDVFVKNFSYKYSFVKEFRDKNITESKVDNNNNYIYLLVNKDESSIFASPKFKKDKLGRIYKLYLETDTESLYLPIPKLGIEGVLYEPNNTSSISIANDIVLTFKEKADIYESEGSIYATQVVENNKVKISKLNAQYRMVEDMGTVNNITDVLSNPVLTLSNKDVFIEKAIFEENLSEYYDNYVAQAVGFTIVDKDVVGEVINNEDLTESNQQSTTLTNQDVENLFNQYAEQINRSIKMKDGLFAVDITLNDFKQLADTVNTKKELEEFIKKCYSI